LISIEQFINLAEEDVEDSPDDLLNHVAVVFSEALDGDEDDDGEEVP
jgi:hypothetical protein